MELLKDLISICIDRIAVSGSNGILVESALNETLETWCRDNPSSSQTPLKHSLWQVLSHIEQRELIQLHAINNQSLLRKQFPPFNLESTRKIKEMENSSGNRQADEQRPSISAANIAPWTDFIAIACYELRLRALNMPIRAYLTDFEQYHLRILEVIANSRQNGITFGDLLHTLNNDSGGYSMQTNSVELEDDRFVNIPAKRRDTVQYNLKRLHCLLDTLESHDLVVKRMLLVSKPSLKRLNILHLPRFARMFEPSMVSKFAVFEYDDTCKKRLVKSMITFLKMQPNQMAVLMDLKYHLQLERRTFDVLRTYILQEKRKCDEVGSQYHFELFSALRHSNNENGNPQRVNCIRYIDRKKIVLDAPPLAYPPKKGVVIERGLAQQVCDLIVASGKCGATSVEMRHCLGLPGSRLPYKILREICSRNCLRAEQELIGKNEGFRFFSDTAETPIRRKDHVVVINECLQVGSDSNVAEARNSTQNTIEESTMQNSTGDHRRIYSSSKRRKISIRSTLLSKVDSDIIGTRTRRKKHILERLKCEKLITVRSICASIQAMESKLSIERGGSHLEQVTDHRSVSRLAMELQAENCLRYIVRSVVITLPVRKVRLMKVLALPEVERDQQLLGHLLQTCRREEQSQRAQRAKAGKVLSAQDKVDAKFYGSQSLSNEGCVYSCPDSLSLDSSRYKRDLATTSYNTHHYRRDKVMLDAAAKRRQYRSFGYSGQIMLRCSQFHTYLWSYLRSRSISPIQIGHEEGANKTMTDIDFTLNDILREMPISTYIQLFSGGCILTHLECAIVRNAISNYHTMCSLPDTLCRKIRLRELPRVAKLLKILVGLSLVSPPTPDDYYVKLIMPGDLLACTSDRVLGDLRVIGNYSLRLHHVRCVMELAGPDNATVKSTLHNDIRSLRICSVHDKNDGIPNIVPLIFSFKEVKDVEFYWHILKFFCLEKVIVTESMSSSHFDQVTMLRARPLLSGQNMFRNRSWNSRETKVTARSSKSCVHVLVSGTTCSTATRCGACSTTERREREACARSSHILPPPPPTIIRVFSHRKPDAAQKQQNTADKHTNDWNSEQDAQLLELYISDLQSRWKVNVPPELQHESAQVVLRIPSTLTMRPSFGVAAANILRMETDCVTTRLIAKLQEPASVLAIERAKQEFLTDNQIASLSDEEKFMHGSTYLVALFRRAIMIVTCTQKDYKPSVSEQLISQWPPSDIRRVWRYLRLKHWITTTKHNKRRYVMSSRLRSCFSYSGFAFSVSAFLQAAAHSSVASATMNQDNDVAEKRKRARIESLFDVINQSYPRRFGLQEALSSSDEDDLATVKMPPNPSPGQCAFELSGQVVGICALNVVYTPPSDAPDRNMLYVLERMEKRDDLSNAKICAEKERSKRLAGLSAHVQKSVNNVGIRTFLNAWVLNSTTTAWNSEVETDREHWEAFTMTMEKPAKARVQMLKKCASFTKDDMVILQKKIIHIIKEHGQEGIALESLIECISRDYDKASDEKLLVPCLRSLAREEIEGLSLSVLGSCVEEVFIICVNGYDRPMYLHADYVNQWALRPFAYKQRNAASSSSDIVFYGKYRLAFPWSEQDGEINTSLLHMIQQKMVVYILRNPGVSEQSIFKHLGKALTPQDIREALTLLVDDNVLYARILSVSPCNIHNASLGCTGNVLSNCFRLKSQNVAIAVIKPLHYSRRYQAHVHNSKLHYFPSVDCIQRFGSIIGTPGTAYAEL